MRLLFLFAAPLIATSFGFAPPTPNNGAGAAARLMATTAAKIRALKGYELESKTVITFESQASRPAGGYQDTVSIKFVRSNLFDMSHKESNFPDTFRYVSDGKDVYSVFRGTYSKTPIDPTADSFSWLHNDLFLFLLKGSFSDAVEAPFPLSYSMLPDQTVEGQTCKVVGAQVGGGYPINYEIYIGPDGFPKRIVHTEDRVRKFVQDSTITKFLPDPSIQRSAFRFQPTPDLKPAPARNDAPTALTIGDEAPEFSLPTLGGKRLSLSQALSGKRALLLNFWFVGCPPCRAEHPKLQRFCESFASQGLGVLAVDDQDAPALVAQYMQGAGLKFPTVLSGPRVAIDPKTGFRNYQGPMLPDYKQLKPYGINWCPTNILLDSNGKVVYIADKWDEAGLRKALNDLGFE